MIRARTRTTSSELNHRSRRTLIFFATIAIVSTSNLASLAGAATSNPNSGQRSQSSSPGTGASSPNSATLIGTLPSWASAGSTLTVFTWPAVGVPVVGSDIPLTQLATSAVSGANFSEVIFPEGSQNILLFLTNGSQESTSFASLSPSQATPTAVPMAASGSSGSVSQKSMTILTAPFAKAIAALPIVGHSGALTSAASGALPRAVASRLTINGCSAQALSSSAPTWTPIGQVHTVNQTSAFFTYGTSTSSSFSVGISSSNAFGSFSANGTVATNGGSSSGFNVAAGVHQFVNTQFIYTDYKLTCVAGRSLYYEYAVASSNWHGGLQLGAPAPTNPQGACNHLTDQQVLPSQYQGEDFGSTASLDAGINLLGFDFSEMISYTSLTNIQWHNGGSTTTYLCGSNESSPPGGQPIIYNSATQY